MEEGQEPYLPVAPQDKKKLEPFAMINVQKVIRCSGLTAIKIAQQDSEMMACSADSPNMEEEQDTPGDGVMAGHTAACSRDARKTMELEIVSTMGLWYIPSASQAIPTSDAAFVGLILQIVSLWA